MEIVVDAGDGIRVYDIAATRAGRRVEVTTGPSVRSASSGGKPLCSGGVASRPSVDECARNCGNAARR